MPGLVARAVERRISDRKVAGSSLGRIAARKRPWAGWASRSHTPAQWGVTIEQLAPVISSCNSSEPTVTHGAQVNSAFHPSGVDK